MTLNELKKHVDTLIEQGKGVLEVIVSKDAEGNGFNDVDELTTEKCFENEPVHPDDVGTEYDEKDITEKITIWSI